jgi:hypothetical protein
MRKVAIEKEINQFDDCYSAVRSFVRWTTQFGYPVNIKSAWRDDLDQMQKFNECFSNSIASIHKIVNVGSSKRKLMIGCELIERC